MCILASLLSSRRRVLVGKGSEWHYSRLKGEEKIRIKIYLVKEEKKKVRTNSEEDYPN